MKHLAAMHVVSETAADIYIGTPCSNAFTESEYRDGIIYTYVSHTNMTCRGLDLSHSLLRNWNRHGWNWLIAVCLADMMYLVLPLTHCQSTSNVLNIGIPINQSMVLSNILIKRSCRTSPGWIRTHHTCPFIVVT